MLRGTLHGLALVFAILSMSAGAHAEVEQADDEQSQSYSAFRQWLNADKTGGRATEFHAFERFLVRHGVSDIVPAWQLMRAEADYAQRCNLSVFGIPPRADWPAILPALRAVKQHVIPLLGRVEVSSAWRSPALNQCANGAKGSRHLKFAALDLIAPQRTDKRKMFTDLCAMHARIGAKSRMGLGAYYDSNKPQANPTGRFHIDATGYRSWGFDYTSRSSFCSRIKG